MKGLMVTLLMLCAASFACAQQPANDEGGKFVLRLNDALIEDLKVNPGGLSALIKPEDQGKITEVLILYSPPKSSAAVTKTTAPAQQQVVARQDFTPPGTNRRPNTRPTSTVDPPITPANPFNARPLPRFNNTTTPELELPKVATNTEPIPGQDWLPVGDYTDFVPVARKEDWIREVPSRVNPSLQTNTADNRLLPMNRTQDWQTRNPIQNRSTPNTNTGDQFVNHNIDQQPDNRLAQSQEQLRQMQVLYNQQMQQNEQMMLQYQQKLAQQNSQLEQMQQRLVQQDNHFVSNQFANTNPNFIHWPPNYVQKNPQPVDYQEENLNRRLDNLDQKLEYVMRNGQPNESYSDRLASRGDERALENPSIPGRRTRPKTDEQSPSSLRAQIPGPNERRNIQGTQTELEANLNSYKRTNGFLLFMLLCSVGINIYLGMISRNFYTRYAELADELRETFTATM